MTLPAQSAVVSAADLTTMVCGGCGGIYAIAEIYRQNKYDSGGYWHCPYCEIPWGYGTSAIDSLNKKLTEAQRQVDLERKRTEWAQQEARTTEYRRRVLKGQVTKIKKRIGNGVCPCCNRSFEDLRRHMNTKHPDYKK